MCKETRETCAKESLMGEGGAGGIYHLVLEYRPFQRYPQSKDILIISVWNAQVSKLIISIVHLIRSSENYVKDVVVVKLFPSVHPSRHPSMDGIIQGRKPWQK